MKKFITIAMTALLLSGCGGSSSDSRLFTPDPDEFDYVVDQFADLQIIRYRVAGIENLSLQQQELLYYMSEAALCGRDIIYDQHGKYNLRLRSLLEAVYTSSADRSSDDFKALELYLKRFWVSNDFHHHYSGDKFVPAFSEPWFEESVRALPVDCLPLADGQSVDEMLAELMPIIFDPDCLALYKNQTAGADLLRTSSSNYYEGVSQREAEEFYLAMKDTTDAEPISYGLNSKLVKRNGTLVEDVYRVGGLYGAAMEKIVYWLEKAAGVAETDAQRVALEKLISFYRTGDLREYDEYSILWLKDTESLIDYICSYTENYGDPLGYKADWEGFINFKSVEATKRTETISRNAQWFEDNSPVDPRFKKEKCKGITAKVINAAMLSGDSYPTPPLGINLPNADWIRAAHGSKSVSIDNVAEAYAQAAAGSGFNEEFSWSEKEIELLDKYRYITDNIHTDLHECLGHGSGKLLPGVSADTLGAYHAVIEEARADLFGLYYVADPKMVELGLLPNDEAYKAQYYAYFQNGLMTQLYRIELGKNLEQTHMRDRQLICSWVLDHASEDKAVEIRTKEDGRYFIVINDYVKLREHIADLLCEIQRIKSTGDFDAAKAMVETYGVKINYDIHKQVLERYAHIKMTPYKAFVNPVLSASFDEKGRFAGLEIDYTENFVEQNLRYSRDYSYLK